MKATKIYYEELRTFGQYNNRKIGIELEIADDEKAADVFHKAKLFAQACLASDGLTPELVENVVRSVKSAQDNMNRLIDKAQETLRLDDEIPF